LIELDVPVFPPVVFVVPGVEVVVLVVSAVVGGGTVFGLGLLKSCSAKTTSPGGTE